MINLDNICQKAIDGIDDLQGIYIKEKLIESCKNIIRESMDSEGIRDSGTIQAALELITNKNLNGNMLHLSYMYIDCMMRLEEIEE